MRTPIVWVTTSEAITVIDKIAKESDRPVFRMTTLDGLLVYKNNKWVRVLVEDLTSDIPGMLIPVYDPNIGLHHVYDNKGVILVENAHLMVEGLIGFLSNVSEKWYRSFYEDDAKKTPMSIVLLSHTSEVPNELKHIAAHYEDELSSEEEFDEIVIDMINKAGLSSMDSTERKLITRAAAGMSHFEFVNSSIESLLDHGHLDVNSINAAKINILSRGGVLSMRIPKLKMSDIGGMDSAKQILKKTTWIWNHPDEAKELQIQPIRKVLLVGIPGTGKSALCEATASELGLELAKFGVGAMMNKFVGESEANMRRAFAQIAKMAPLCLWIDELGRDFSGGQSSGSVDGGTTDRVHGELLSGLQDLPEDVFLVCAANRIDDLPPEMLRADRFDKIMFVGFPTLSERMEIFKIHLGESSVNNYNIEALAEATVNFTPAEIKALIKETRFQISADKHRPPTTDEMLEIAKTLKGRVWNTHRAAIQDMYQKALTNWDWASKEQFEEAQQTLQKPAPAKTVERKVSSLTDSGSFFK